MVETAVDRRLLWLGAIALLLALAWRPFVLGFYHDDWFHLIVPDLTAAPFSIERWDQLEVTQNRPVFRFLAFFLHSVLPANPVVWQTWLVVLQILTAGTIALAGYTLTILSFDQKTSRIAAGVGALFWLVFPWGAPNAFWPTASTAYFSVMGLCLSTWLIIGRWEVKSLQPKVWVFVLSLASYLCYEAIYFQLFPILVFAAWRFGWRRRHTIAWSVTVIVPQLIAFGANRYLSSIGAEGSRKFNTNFLETFYYWFGYGARELNRNWMTWQLVALIVVLAIFGVLLFISRQRILADVKSANPLSVLLLLSWSVLLTSSIAVTITLPMAFLETVIVFIPLFLLIVVFTIMAWRALPPGVQETTLWTGGLALSELCLAALAFAAGNFVMWSTGMGGRVTVIISVWLAVGITLVTAVVMVGSNRKQMAAIVGGALWLTLFTGILFRAGEWHQSWVMQKEVLANVPLLTFSALTERSAYLYTGPEQLEGRVPVIETNWHMGAFATAAFWGQAVTLDQKTMVRKWTHRWMVSRMKEYRITWDGTALKRYLCENLTEPHDMIEADTLWVWDGWNKTFSQAEPGLNVGCR